MNVFHAAGSAVVTLVIVTATSCDNHETSPPAQLPFEGIREFDEFCNPVGGDTTDFMPQPLGGNYSLEGVCPNPTRGPTANITFQIPQPDSVWLFVYERTNTPPSDTLYSGRLSPGRHRFTWNNPNVGGLFRVEMNTKSGFRSYGDVQFTPAAEEPRGVPIPPSSAGLRGGR